MSQRQKITLSMLLFQWILPIHQAMFPLKMKLCITLTMLQTQVSNQSLRLGSNRETLLIQRREMTRLSKISPRLYSMSTHSIHLCADAWSTRILAESKVYAIAQSQRVLETFNAPSKHSLQSKIANAGMWQQLWKRSQRQHLHAIVCALTTKSPQTSPSLNSTAVAIRPIWNANVASTAHNSTPKSQFLHVLLKPKSSHALAKIPLLVS